MLIGSAILALITLIVGLQHNVIVIVFTTSLFTPSRSCLLVISKSSTWPRHSLFAIIVFFSRSTFYFCQSVVSLALMCVVCGIRRMSKIMSITRSHPVSTLYTVLIHLCASVLFVMHAALPVAISISALPFTDIEAAVANATSCFSRPPT